MDDETFLKQFPLRSKGRLLVTADKGKHFRLKGVNWYGASDCCHVPGGLSAASVQQICETIKAIGFNVVRLPWSNEAVRLGRSVECSGEELDVTKSTSSAPSITPVIPDGCIDFNINPELHDGARSGNPLAILDYVVEQLGKNHITVVINNHTTYGRWSGGLERNGLWFDQHDNSFSEASWIDDWVFMVKRYSHLPFVVGCDLRNEVRPVSLMRSKSRPYWESQDDCTSAEECDVLQDANWCRAAGRAARAIINDTKFSGFVCVERIAWPQKSISDILGGRENDSNSGSKVRPTPCWVAWGIPRSRIIFGVHAYSWSGPGHWSPKCFTSGALLAALNIRDRIAGRRLYGEMEESQLHAQLDAEFGFALNADIAPVWISEFGTDTQPYNFQWFQKIVNYMISRNCDYAYWPLNVGPKPSLKGAGGANDDELYGLLTPDWRPNWSDDRLHLMRLLTEAPLPEPPNEAKLAAKSGK